MALGGHLVRPLSLSISGRLEGPVYMSLGGHIFGPLFRVITVNIDSVVCVAVTLFLFGV